MKAPKHSIRKVVTLQNNPNPVVAAWPSLPGYIRAAIRALLGTVSGPS